MRPLRLACLVTLLAAATLPAQTPPALPAVVAKMYAYLKSYGEQYAATIATEHYRQISGLPNDTLRREALLESDFGIIRLPGIGQWIGLRDVFRVDGKPVADRQDRLAKLFADSQDAALSQADRIILESARFNIGPVRRTINNPAIVLKLLDPVNEFRLRFSKGGEETQDGVRLWLIDFFEQSVPTLIRTTQGDDEPSRGRLWVEPLSGRLRRADITFRNSAPGQRSFRASLSLTFQEEPRLHIWVPARMVERYESSEIDYVGGDATYTDYRQFGVKTQEEFTGGLPPPFPRTNATRLLDTDRITVWDIVWPKGQPTAMHRHVYDQVGTYYSKGGRLITTPDGAARAVITEVGSLSTTRKGTTHIEEGNTDPPLRAVFIELKQETASGLPGADVGGPAPFPRDGAKQILDDERVTAWDYTWASGSTGLRYRPARETVIVWLGAGRLRVTRNGGDATVTDVKPGTMHHMTRGSNDTVEIVSGSPRAILFQLK